LAVFNYENIIYFVAVFNGKNMTFYV